MPWVGDKRIDTNTYKRTHTRTHTHTHTTHACTKTTHESQYESLTHSLISSFKAVLGVLACIPWLLLHCSVCADVDCCGALLDTRWPDLLYLFLSNSLSFSLSLALLFFSLTHSL